MIDAVRNFLVTLARTLRVADLIDVVLVAFFLYVIFSWVRRSMSQSAVRGIGVLLAIFAGVYLSARFFEMYLIEQVTTVIFAVILLAAIVAFQADLRRMFDRTGTWVFSWRSSSAPSEVSTVDLLVEAVAELAEARTGALIAIRGAEPWDHHIQGGIELGGAISPPLLYSLFDHRTPGHDGALLIEGNQITKFAVHLPLAMHLPRASRYGGTRHAAALGLAEVCDAFVVVVSEERGTVSAAREGVITELEAASELKERLGQFWQEHYGEDQLRGTWLSRRSGWAAALSLVLSTLLWFLFAYSPEMVYRSFDVPVEYRDVPPNWMIQEGPATAHVTLSGPDQAFRSVDPGQLAIAFSLAQPQDGENELTVDRSDLDLPEQLTLDRVDPRTVRVVARPLTSTVLPVHIPSQGRLPDSLQLIALRAEPDSVTVLMPKGDTYKRVITEPVHLDSVRQTTALKRSLMLPDNVRLPDRKTAAVTVYVTVQSTSAGSSGP